MQIPSIGYQWQNYAKFCPIALFAAKKAPLSHFHSCFVINCTKIRAGIFTDTGSGDSYKPYEINYLPEYVGWDVI